MDWFHLRALRVTSPALMSSIFSFCRRAIDFASAAETAAAFGFAICCKATGVKSELLGPRFLVIYLVKASVKYACCQ